MDGNVNGCLSLSALWWAGNLSRVYPVTQTMSADVSERKAIVENGWIFCNSDWTAVKCGQTSGQSELPLRHYRLECIFFRVACLWTQDQKKKKETGINVMYNLQEKLSY